MILLQLANSGDEVLLFYNDNSFHTLVGLMKAEGPLSGISYTHIVTYTNPDTNGAKESVLFS